MPQPFGKAEPLDSKQALVTPPARTFEKAGPGAAHDIDMETLLGPDHAASAGSAPLPASSQEGGGQLVRSARLQADPITTDPLAKTAAPALVAKAESIPTAPDAGEPPAPSEAAGLKAGAQPKDKPSQKPAIAAVTVPPVTGDSAREELTVAMRETLTKAGWPVRATGGKDVMKITGIVRVGQPHGTAQTVSLAWEVFSPDGRSLGLISQTNDVPANSLSNGWGDNASLAVEAAAGGIFDLIDKYR